MSGNSTKKSYTDSIRKLTSNRKIKGGSSTQTIYCSLENILDKETTKHIAVAYQEE